MTKQKEAENELREIAQRLREFGEKYEYSFVSISFHDGSLYAWTPDGEPNRLDIYMRR